MKFVPKNASSYKITVYMTPDYTYYPLKPYHWIVFVYHDGWCNEGAGWAHSTSEAWAEAHAFFETHVKGSLI